MHSNVWNGQFLFIQVGPLLGESHPLNESNSLYGVAFYSILLLFSLFNYRFLATLQVIPGHSK